MADQVGTQSEQSVEDRMLAFLGGDEPNESEVPDEEQEAEPATEEQEADPPDEGEEQETKDEPEPERVLKIKHDGVEIEKPESEVIALAQQGFDYTQKTQKLAEERKYVETMTSTIREQEKAFQQQVEIQAALIQEIAAVTALDNQVNQYQNLDWAKLSDSDPVEAQKLFFAYNQLQVQRNQAIAALNNRKQELAKAQSAARAKQLELGQQVLARDIPGWNDEIGKEIAATGREYGFTAEELSNLTDPRAVKLLQDASKWRKLQASKPIVDKKVATASPTVKPGAKTNATADRAKVAQARAELKKTGNANLAARLIERML